MNEKKTYSSPVVTVHGSVEELTQASNHSGGDVPHGIGNAYS
jgi:hypothetical protein